MRAPEVGRHSFGQLCGGQQPVGLYHRPLAMYPVRFQRVQSGTFVGQGTPHNPYSLAIAFDLLVVLSEPVPHRLAFMPRGIIPDQQQSRLAQGRQLGTEPAQEGNGAGTHWALGTNRSQTGACSAPGAASSQTNRP